jgi:hypothetical protein
MVSALMAGSPESHNQTSTNGLPDQRILDTPVLSRLYLFDSIDF